MGFSAITAHVIFAVALLAASSSLVVAFFNAEDDVEAEWRADWDRRDAVAHTEMNVTSVAFASGTITIEVDNTGSTTLDPSEVEIILDGAYATSSIATLLVEGVASSVWAPGDELVLTLPAGGLPATLAIVAENGVAEYWRS